MCIHTYILKKMVDGGVTVFCGNKLNKIDFAMVPRTHLDMGSNVDKVPKRSLQQSITVQGAHTKRQTNTSVPYDTAEKCTPLSLAAASFPLLGKDKFAQPATPFTTTLQTLCNKGENNKPAHPTNRMTHMHDYLTNREASATQNSINPLPQTHFTAVKPCYARHTRQITVTPSIPDKMQAL